MWQGVLNITVVGIGRGEILCGDLVRRFDELKSAIW